MQSYLHTPPFDVLSYDEREALSKHTRIVYVPSGAALSADWQDDFFVLLKGRIHERLGDELIASFHNGDWFLMVPAVEFIPMEECLLLRLDGQAVKASAEQNATLKNLVFADFSNKIAEHGRRTSIQLGQSLLHNPISDLGEHIKSPIFVQATDTLYQAVLTMNGVNAKHVLVQDGEQVGMFTQADVCRAIAVRADFEAVAVRDFSVFNLKSIQATADVSDALLLMVSHKIHRLPIMDNGQIVGVIGQSELLGYLSHHSELIASRIDQATTLEELGVAVAMVGKFIRTQHQHGTKVYVISRMVQSLNLHIFSKLWALIAPKELQENSCVIVMGSEGRGEQIMRTDQDNALILRDNFVIDNLQEITNHFNTALDALGYPYCTGSMMMNNPIWCQSLGAFKERVSGWVQHAHGDNLIYLSVLLDGAVVCGDGLLFEELRRHLHEVVKTANTGFINRFAKPAIEFGDGSSFWQKFTGGGDHDIDLKKAGIFPIVHGVRALALEYDICESSTKYRLQALTNKGVLDKEVAQNLMEALAFFLSKRLEVALTQPDKSARKVNPTTLSALDKDLLKESLAIVKAFKGYLVRHYRLDIF